MVGLKQDLVEDANEVKRKIIRPKAGNIWSKAENIWRKAKIFNQKLNTFEQKLNIFGQKYLSQSTFPSPAEKAEGEEPGASEWGGDGRCRQKGKTMIVARKVKLGFSQISRCHQKGKTEIFSQIGRCRQKCETRFFSN